MIFVGIAAFIGYWWLWFTGCESPACRVIGVYTHKVTTLAEYKEYLTGADLYVIHCAASLRFDCEGLRDEVVQYFHEGMLNDPSIRSKSLTEAERHSLVGAWRQDRALHLKNSVTVSPFPIFSVSLESWVEQVSSLLESDQARRFPASKDMWLFMAVRRLFDAVVLHSEYIKKEIPITEKSKCDRRQD